MTDKQLTVYVCILDNHTLTVFDNRETAEKYCNYHQGNSEYWEAPIYSKFLIDDEILKESVADEHPTKHDTTKE